MNFSPDNIYHIYNQGNNRQPIFHKEDDYITFLNLYKSLLSVFANTIAWCLMPNHFHFMIHTDERCLEKKKQGGITIDPLTNGFRKLLSGYARIFNAQNNRSGSLFRQKTKAKALAEMAMPPGSPYQLQDLYTNCFHYIHQNPVRAKLVPSPEDWIFSSYRDYAGLRNGTLCRKDLASLYCGYDPDFFLIRSREPVDEKILPFLRL